MKQNYSCSHLDYRTKTQESSHLWGLEYAEGALRLDAYGHYVPYGGYGAADGWNPLASPRSDGYFSTALSSRVAPRDGASSRVADPSSDGARGAALGGAYGGRLTLRGVDDGLARGPHNVSVRFGAYLYDVRHRCSSDDVIRHELAP